MRLSSIALALSCARAALGRFAGEDDVSHDRANPIARSYIIEYAPGNVDKRDGIASYGDIAVVKTFDSDVFSGATVETKDHDLDSLSALPGVDRVWPNAMVRLGSVSPKIATEIPSPEKYFPHNATGVSKLHEQGILGKGAKVAVVDSGIWYKHPALGGGFGEGKKVAGGYDFVGDGLWPMNGTKKPDDDPIDYLGHGTHVAGIVAGKTDGWTGVAPEATLYAYKVMGVMDAADYATLIEAFLRAYDDGVDIITCSIGGPNGFSSQPWAVVASRLVEKGLVVAMLAGNRGDLGPVFGPDGGSGENVITVASAQTESLPAFPFIAIFTIGGKHSSSVLGYVPATHYFPPSVAGWPIVPLSLNTTNPAEACQPYPKGYRNLIGVIPLVRRGTCSLEIKQGNLLALGAEYMLFYNNESPMIPPGTQNPNGLFGLMTADTGKAIIDAVKAGGKVTADFSLNPENPIGSTNPTGSAPERYTEWGPLYDLSIKPDIAAPGGNIFSTFTNDSFALISGTSMATPYVAGIAALYISAHGGRHVHGNGFGKQLIKKIISSGTSLPWFNGTDKMGFAASVAQVGNGLVNGFKVVNYTTSIAYEKFHLNDTAHFQASHDVVVVNNGDKDVEYTFSTQASAGVEVLGYFGSNFDLPYTRAIKAFDSISPKDLSVEVSLPTEFKLGPGESKTVSVVFENPDKLGWNQTVLPIYSGKVILSSSQGEQLSIPYLGLGANLRKEMAPNYIEVPRAVSTVKNFTISEKPYFSFNLSLAEQDFPRVYASLIWGSKQIRWDIFDKV